VGFATGSRLQIGVFRLAAAARKAHLTGVVPEVFGPFGKEDLAASALLDDGGKHRRLSVRIGQLQWRVPADARQVHTFLLGGILLILRENWFQP
jgi:hypothetical protein